MGVFSNDTGLLRSDIPTQQSLSCSLLGSTHLAAFRIENHDVHFLLQLVQPLVLKLLTTPCI